MPFELRYHPDVKDVDIPAFTASARARIKRAIGTRPAAAPHQYAEPFRKTLKGYWKLRVGDYRVVFKIAGNEVRILGIMDRKEVCERIGKRKPQG